MKVTFWGVRGSIPCKGPSTVKYAGNTACVEIRFDEIDRMIIVDAGSGIRPLGNHMVAHDFPKGMNRVEIYLTHTHWDHILGFPFFTPIYIPGTKILIHGPTNYEEDSLENIVGGQLIYRYFPVRGEELASEIEYIDLGEDTFDLKDGITLTTKYLNHPIRCIGYRFEYKGKSVCTVYDTEPFLNLFCTDPDDPAYDETMAREGDLAAQEENRYVEEFFAGADLIIHDAQYTREEYTAARKGWGHTAIEYAIDAAMRNNVKRLALFHHDPDRSDEQIDALTDAFCRPEKTGDVEVFFAREGKEIVL